ncbi:hypothetical protein P691DRAFT_756363 [Macrolepiota fuliginosa MF-IS2]|uniref:Uncharacterized protein n=1 Tax=Macrolepiota fuliginosa MF-IS2 TaxID=1400762 RepID=A0A9P6C517_9AGAR|nr:hypothetical protein P691DRAFT_756363 [Macrolepiota fuliginosa MF-IS2]
MKPVAFFRSTWKRKDKDKNMAKGKQDVLPVKRTLVAPESAPCTPTTVTFEIPVTSVLPSPYDHRVCSQSQDTIVFEAPATFPRKARSRFNSVSNASSLVDVDISPPSIVLPDRYDSGNPPQSPVIWKSSHGPPKNAFHGPPNLSLYSPVFGTSPKSVGRTPPTRPPRPPPLNLYPTTTKRPVNTGIPPRFMAKRAITFALPPNPRSIGSAELPLMTINSSSDSPYTSEDQEETPSESSEETARCSCVTISFNENRTQLHRGALDNAHAAANLPHPRYDSLSSGTSPRTAHAVLDLSATPIPEKVYRSGLRASSTPHLPSQNKQEVPPVPPQPFNLSNGQADDASNFPLSLFPPPPSSPLFIRRKISKNLVLRPKPTPRLSPSPAMASPDYTPLVMPSTPHHQTSPNQSKLYPSLHRYASPRAIPPPLFDPPSTPLPTPPTTPSPSGGRGASPLPTSKSLRSVRSTNQLRPEPPTHRATSSEPASLPETRRQVQPRPDVFHEAHAAADSEPAVSDSQTEWGYAI